MVAYRNVAVLPFVAAAVALAAPVEEPTEFAPEDVIADAASRQTLAAPGPGTGGHDGRFFVQSTDDLYRLELRAEAQFRFYSVFDAEDDTPPAGDAEDITTGFEHTRNRIDFRARLYGDQLRIRLRGDFARNGGRFRLVDNYFSYELGGGWSVQAGQYKIAYDREFSKIRGTSGLAVERSLTSTIFRVNRSQGVQIKYDAGDWRAFGTVSDGRAAANTAFTNAAEADIALTGRFELRIGDAGWRQFGDATSFQGADTGVLLGLGGHWQQDGRDLGPVRATGTTNLFMYTADVSYEGDGWNAMAVFYGRTIDPSGEGERETFTDLAFVTQGGLFVSEQTELFARYEHIFPDSDRENSDDFPGFIVGANWYMIPGSHAVKVTGQVMWYPEAQAGSSSVVNAPNSNVGLLPDDDDNQVAIVGQIQLLF